jgi:hypothetical protein
MEFTSAAESFQALPITGTYTVDSDSLMGTLNLTSTKGTESLAIYTTLPPYASGSLIETDGGPVVSSGSFYQQADTVEYPQDITGTYRMALTGETFVSEGTPSPILVDGNLLLDNPANSVFTFFTVRVGSGAPESVSRTLRIVPFPDPRGRMVISAGLNPLNMAAYIIDETHILVVSTDPPQVNPSMSGTITRDQIPTQ